MENNENNTDSPVIGDPKSGLMTLRFGGNFGILSLVKEPSLFDGNIKVDLGRGDFRFSVVGGRGANPNDNGLYAGVGGVVDFGNKFVASAYLNYNKKTLSGTKELYENLIDHYKDQGIHVPYFGVTGIKGVYDLRRDDMSFSFSMSGPITDKFMWHVEPQIQIPIDGRGENVAKFTGKEPYINSKHYDISLVNSRKFSADVFVKYSPDLEGVIQIFAGASIYHVKNEIALFDVDGKGFRASDNGTKVVPKIGVSLNIGR